MVEVSVATALPQKRDKPKATGKSTSVSAANANDPFVTDYGRFSFGKQREGGSKRRQQGDEDEKSPARWYAEKVGLPFNESLSMFDEGFSGFHNENVTKGALGKFLALIEAGMVPKGSILWVESIDRLTRQNPLSGMKMILFGIIERGVGIYVHDLRTLYDSKNVDDQIGELYGEIRRAHRESKRKSELASAAWEQRRTDVRKSGGILDFKTPHWLQLTDKDPKEFVVRPHVKKTFAKLFGLKEKDKSKGPVTLARQLNRLCSKSKGWWKPPGGWTDRYVFRCLKNRALIGEKQPGTLTGGQDGERQTEGDVIPNYYPPVVDRDLFIRVQQILAERKGKQGGGRNDKCHNVMQGLCRCGYCGGPVYHKARTPKSALYCHDRRQSISDCDALEFADYESIQNALIDACRRLDVEQVLPQKDEQAKIRRGLRQQVQRLSAACEELKNRIANLDEIIAGTKEPDRRKRREVQLTTAESELAAKEKELTAARNDLTRAEKKRQDFVDWQANIETLKNSLDDPAMRRRLNAHLKEFIERIEVFSKGPKEDDPESSTFYDYFYAVEDNVRGLAELYQCRLKSKSKTERNREEEFIAWAEARRFTQHGRFLRIHFKTPLYRPLPIAEGSSKKQKTGAVISRTYIDVAPPGSLAGQPDIDSLFTKFKHAKRYARRKSG